MTFEQLYDLFIQAIASGQTSFMQDVLDLDDIVLAMHKQELFAVLEDGTLTPETLAYFNIACNHPLPCDVIHLLGTLNFYKLLSAENLLSIQRNIFPKEIAMLIDRIYFVHPQSEEVQDIFNRLLDISSEKSMTLLQYRLSVRMEKESSSFNLRMFYDELEIMSKAQDTARENLSALAYDPESSIQPLTEDETRRMRGAKLYYDPIVMAQGGVDHCYNNLLDTLKAEYNKDPIYLELATKEITLSIPNLNSLSFFWSFLTKENQSLALSHFIFHSGTSFSLSLGNGGKICFRLPLEKEYFDLLPLTSKHRQQALKLYYKHHIHTAYRFFSDIDAPGPWLATETFWERFTHYKPYLAMLWVAVNDHALLTDDYTFEGRKLNFIETFAQLRRAHNCDKRREVSYGKFAYYDDEEADKPGCIPALNQCAFDAVQGHPLFKNMSAVIQCEIQSLVKSYYKQKITVDVYASLNKAWQSVCGGEPLTPELSHSLSLLNVSKNLQKKWLKQLKAKYDLNEDSDLISKYWSWFKLSDTFPLHAYRFGGMVGLTEMLQSPPATSINLFFQRPQRLQVEDIGLRTQHSHLHQQT